MLTGDRCSSSVPISHAAGHKDTIDELGCLWGTVDERQCTSVPVQRGRREMWALNQRRKGAVLRVVLSFRFSWLVKYWTERRGPQAQAFICVCLEGRIEGWDIKKKKRGCLMERSLIGGQFPKWKSHWFSTRFTCSRKKAPGMKESLEDEDKIKSH